MVKEQVAATDGRAVLFDINFLIICSLDMKVKFIPLANCIWLKVA